MVSTPKARPATGFRHRRPRPGGVAGGRGHGGRGQLTPGGRLRSLPPVIAMRLPSNNAGPGPVLGIEAGGTRTVALLVDLQDRVIVRREGAAANLRLVGDDQLRRHLAGLARGLERPVAVGIGMAGAREESDRARIREAAARCWPGVPLWVGNDLDTAFAAAGELSTAVRARVVVISGTGSCCFGRNHHGEAVKVGGWGHLLGDRGSGYDVALSALRQVLENADRGGRWPVLGTRLLRALALNEPNDLVTWVHAATKADIAALAVEVSAAAAEGDRVARRCVELAAGALATDTVACVARLVPRPGPVEIILTGGLLLRQPGYARLVRRRIRAMWASARIRPLEREGAWGAVVLARALAGSPASARGAGRADRAVAVGSGEDLIPVPEATAPSPTEARNPRSKRLDRLSIGAAVELMLAEDAGLSRALRAERAGIGRAVRLAVASLSQGGRLFYVGAGTSGRLGVLDASECPPTFSVSPDQVQGIIAGGQTALWRSLEGAEDDAAAGRRALEFRGVSRRDFVVGIAASGRTPFVWGALQAARTAGARTALICFNPNLKFARGTRPDVVLAPGIGPEVLTGSTRLKAGTATKQMLNIISTVAMVRLGKVVENLMVDVRPTNVKLRDRAARIVQTLTGVGREAVVEALEEAGWDVKSALSRLRKRPRA